jgi:hypothetical protein
LVVVLCGLLAWSHIAAYRSGRRSVEQDASWRITAAQGIDAEAVLNVSLRSAQAAQTTPAAFGEADRRYLSLYLNGAADEVETKLIPQLPRIYPEPGKRSMQLAQAEAKVRRAREAASALVR